jgi:UPF0755 protein
MKKALKFLFFAVTLVILSAGYAGYLYWQGIGKAMSDDKKLVVFEIKAGQGVKAISQNLLENKLISSKLFFEIYIWQRKWQNSLMAGDYELRRNMTIKEIAKAVKSGDALSKETSILIKEGLNSEDIGKIFEDAEMFSKDSFLRTIGYPRVDYSRVLSAQYPSLADYSDKFSFLSDKPDQFSYEDYLFPDTYRFFKKATPSEVLVKMLDNFDKKLTPQMRQDIALQQKSVFQIVVMASLIEKEVRKTEDMKMVSGIFWHRLSTGQRLESCATLAYILGVNKRQYTIEDTEIRSPYNTYRNYGLPPSPIANPGLKAIEAAIYPEKTDYNYFLTATDGTTVYARTFDEHVRNKLKYLD